MDKKFLSSPRCRDWFWGPLSLLFRGYQRQHGQGMCSCRLLVLLTLSNPIFLPTAYSPALICFGRERGWWITGNYPTVLKEKNIEKQKEYSLRYLLAKVHTTWGKRRTGSDSGRTNGTKTVSDVFRHRSGTGKSYCRTRSDV